VFKNLAWCITGGGTHLKDTVDVMHNIKYEFNVKLTIFLTKWGLEVARIFGVLPKIKDLALGGYYEEFLVEDEGMYYIGRMNMRRYKALIIAPATTNTIAKMVYGIADNIASALYAQASKSCVSTIILPTDTPSIDGYIEVETPCYIDRSICIKNGCISCKLVEMCPVKAITIVDDYPRIDLSKCTGCEKCVRTCPNNAIKCWGKVKIKPRTIDLENIEKLKVRDYTYVISNTEELIEKIKYLLQKA